MFSKILVANRGEIACRVFRTARAAGIRSVAVYSEPDSSARHVRMADEAVCIGPAPAAESYLNIGRLLAAARECSAEAVHPGYGFLSESPEFAAACLEAGITFIGPPPEVIRAMGIKSQARKMMEKAAIPVIPGGYIDPANREQVIGLANKIGYPLLIKADRGGGGKGIRLVQATEDLADAVAGAGREASSAFGDNSLLLEKHVVRARHVEVQIFRDALGNCVHLFERDCSLQRRHQKILEEAPAFGLADEVRQRLYQAAVTAAETIGYIGAGTVEFLVDESGSIYFLEINTRLQVEHPVTEMITGQDLVHWQLLVAAGKTLPCSQDELVSSGHAIEVRIYAEDPYRGFLPSSGQVCYMREPAQSEKLRIDRGIDEGDTVTPYYDPIMAKLIVHGRDRDEALALLGNGLREYHLAGLATNIDFLTTLAVDEVVETGSHTVQYIDDNLESLTETQQPRKMIYALAALYLFLENRRELQEAERGGDVYSPWRSGGGFRVNGEAFFVCSLSFLETRHDVCVCPGKDSYRLQVGDSEVTIGNVSLNGSSLSCKAGYANISADICRYGRGLTVFCEGRTWSFALLSEEDGEFGRGGAEGDLRAPIPGNVTEVFAADGDEVKKGQPLMVLEAMKMEYVIRAPSDGRIARILFLKGDSVQERQRLVSFEPAGGGE